MKTYGRLLVFFLLLLLLVSRNTQDMAERMFWLDEVYDFVAVNQSFWEIPKFTIKGAFTQPPLFYWIGYLVEKIGNDPMTLRSISLVSYIAMIGFVIFALKEFLFPTRIFLSFVLIMSSFGAYATTEFRPYALAALSILVSSVLFYRALTRPYRWSAAVSYGLAALALQYSLTLNCLTFGLQMVFLSMGIICFCYKEGVKKTILTYKPLIMVSIPLCLGYAFFLISVMQAGMQWRPVTQFDLMGYLKALLNNLGVLQYEIIFIRSWAISFAPASLLLGCMVGLWRRRWVTVYLMLLLGGQVLFSTFMTFSRIEYAAPQRYFVASYVAFALLCAIGAESLLKLLQRKTAVLVTVCLLLTTLPAGIIHYARSLKTPGFNPITEAVETMRCKGRPTVVLSDPWRNNFVAWYAYRNDPLIITPHQIRNFPFVNDPAEEIMKAASKKNCFILLEGPQKRVFKGETYKMLSSLPGYSEKRFSITPGHLIPDSAWLFTPLDTVRPVKKDE